MKAESKKPINRKWVERVVNHWIHRHQSKVRALRAEHPNMSRGMAELRAAQLMEPLWQDDDLGFLRAVSQDIPEILEVIKTLSQYFGSPSDIGGPTRGMTCGGGRHIIRKGHEFS